MTGTPPVPAGNTSPYPLQTPTHTHHESAPPAGPVIRTPERRDPAPSGLAMAFFGAALVAGTAAIALAISARYGDD